MATEKIELTKEGEAKLTKELRHLIDIDRPEVLDQLAAARAQGDLSENADYDAARNKQAEVEARIKEIENILANAKIIDEKKQTSKLVALGSTVEIKDLSDNTKATYTIVGTVEANPTKGLISNVSPLGKAIVGKKVGDVCVVRVAREYKVEILKLTSAK
ncbi:MAG: transcription elongation factor GreA [Bacilli bacterium]|nr:transcription elongation factor GreA [Bacilli bacterium]MBR0194073.1 transcription elongation factor GreA [Bacilli bacterium]MDY6362702.1 transcription elongation factor GreA [Bacilli bacterium]